MENQQKLKSFRFNFKDKDFSYYSLKTIVYLLLILSKLINRDRNSNYILGANVSSVNSRKEKIFAEKLLYQEYLKKKLCKVNTLERYINVFSFLPSTTTLVSRNRKNKIIATLSIMEDSDFGLPADSLYKSELDIMRNKGLKLVEIGSLALDNSAFRKNKHSLRSIRKFAPLSSLFTIMINHVYQFTEASHLIIMVNPRHVDMYRYFGFNQFSDIRQYDLVGKPAVPMILSIEEFISAADTNVASLFVVQHMRVMKQSRIFRPEFEDLLLVIDKQPEFLIGLSVREQNLLLRCYPQLNDIMELFKLPVNISSIEDRNASNNSKSAQLDI